MTSPIKPWESNSLHNSTQMHRIATNNLRDIPTNTRSAPALPPLPRNSPLVTSTGYMPYSNGKFKVHPNLLTSQNSQVTVDTAIWDMEAMACLTAAPCTILTALTGAITATTCTAWEEWGGTQVSA